MKRFLQFLDLAYVESGAIDSAFKQGAVDEVGISFDAAYTGVVANVSQDAALKLLGVLELVHFGAPVVKADARLLYHLASVLHGGYHNLLAQATSGGDTLARFSLPFGRLFPDAGLDASGSQLFWRGQFRPRAYYSGTAPTAVTGRLRPFGITVSEAPPGGFITPSFLEYVLRTESAALNHSLQIDFKAETWVPGLLLLAIDDSGSFGTDAGLRVDGLIRKLTVERTVQGRPTDKVVDNATWGQLRLQTVMLARFSVDDETTSVGAVWVPLVESRIKGGGPLLLPRGSSLTITADTSSTVEDGYTAVTPATGDKLMILLPGFLSRRDAAKDASPTELNVGVRARRAGNARRRQFVL